MNIQQKFCPLRVCSHYVFAPCILFQSALLAFCPRKKNASKNESKMMYAFFTASFTPQIPVLTRFALEKRYVHMKYFRARIGRILCMQSSPSYTRKTLAIQSGILRVIQICHVNIPEGYVHTAYFVRVLHAFLRAQNTPNYAPITAYRTPTLTYSTNIRVCLDNTYFYMRKKRDA